MRAKKIRNEGQHVVHLRFAALIRGLPRRHRVGAHPKAFDPAVDELVGLVERYVIVDQVAKTLRDLIRESLDPRGKLRIQQSGTAAGSLHVQRPRVVHERNDGRHTGFADRLQHSR